MHGMDPIRSFYNRTIRRWVLRLVGRRVADFSGVKVKYPAITDLSRTFDHKQENLSAIKETVQEGDHVVEIGTGHAVLTVHAVRQGATVTTYEGSREMARRARDTLTRNNVMDAVYLQHAVVGVPVDIWDENIAARVVNPSELPEMDVLLLDCEGSELSVIEALSHRPRAIIVETHPPQGVPTDAVVDALRIQGYSVESIRAMNDQGKTVVVAR